MYDKTAVKDTVFYSDSTAEIDTMSVEYQRGYKEGVEYYNKKHNGNCCLMNSISKYFSPSLPELKGESENYKLGFEEGFADKNIPSIGEFAFGLFGFVIAYYGIAVLFSIFIYFIVTALF